MTRPMVAVAGVAEIWVPSLPRSRSRWPTTIQVSWDSWSRTSAAASSIRRIEYATVPTRSSWASSERSSGRGAAMRSASVSSSPSATKPGNVPVVRVNARNNRSRQAAPAGLVRGENSARRSCTTRRRRTRSSARSAYRPNQNRFSAARADMASSGSTGTTSSSVIIQKFDIGSGSDASTQVSLETAPSWFVMTDAAGSVDTRVKPPGMTV